MNSGKALRRVPTKPAQPIYRKRAPRRGLDLITAAEFAQALFTQEPCDQPELPRFPEEQWYCPSEDCEARIVIVHRKILDGPPQRKQLCCPQCGGRVKFIHYLREVMLEKIG